MRHPNTEDEYWERFDRRVEAARDRELFEPTKQMKVKRYLENIICLCSDQLFGQEAVEWAIMSNLVTLTYNLEADLKLIMGEEGKPDTGLYSAIIEAYQKQISAHEAMLMETYDLPFLQHLQKAA